MLDTEERRDSGMTLKPTLVGEVRPMSEGEWKARVELAALYRITSLLGWDEITSFRQNRSPANLARELKNLKIVTFGRDYAHTLRLWRQDFMAQRDQVLALGFDEKFIRTWEFYLAYCEAAFEQGNTDVVQYTLLRPEHA